PRPRIAGLSLRVEQLVARANDVAVQAAGIGEKESRRAPAAVGAVGAAGLDERVDTVGLGDALAAVENGVRSE
ncbi:MAG TPA: hypothetical protein VJ723_11790, partial [Candidatus Angelobacter sp.]|nr:hypothetical protein [Candidatus Angelobacter sp.]